MKKRICFFSRQKVGVEPQFIITTLVPSVGTVRRYTSKTMSNTATTVTIVTDVGNVRKIFLSYKNKILREKNHFVLTYESVFVDRTPRSYNVFVNKVIKQTNKPINRYRNKTF